MFQVTWCPHLRDQQENTITSETSARRYQTTVSLGVLFSVLLGYCASSLGDWGPTFQDIVMVPPSRVGYQMKTQRCKPQQSPPLLIQVLGTGYSNSSRRIVIFHTHFLGCWTYILSCSLAHLTGMLSSTRVRVITVKVFTQTHWQAVAVERIRNPNVTKAWQRKNKTPLQEIVKYQQQGQITHSF